MNVSLPVILALAVAFLTGCVTAPPVDWNARIGNYTYYQAVAELGPPDRQSKLSDGKIVCKWFAQTPVNNHLNSGMTSYGNNGFGAGQPPGGVYNNELLQLTFDTNSTLTVWLKNY